jgi:hypothetical protein
VGAAAATTMRRGRRRRNCCEKQLLVSSSSSSSLRCDITLLDYGVLCFLCGGFLVFFLSGFFGEMGIRVLLLSRIEMYKKLR